MPILVCNHTPRTQAPSQGKGERARGCALHRYTTRFNPTAYRSALAIPPIRDEGKGRFVFDCPDLGSYVEPKRKSIRDSYMP